MAGKPLDLFQPERPGRGAVIFLHPVGEETLAENAAYTGSLHDQGLLCAAPHGRRSWWSDRICPEFDTQLSAEAFLLGEVLPHVRTLWGWESRPIGLFGISMGGQGAIRLAFKHPRKFPVAASIAGAFDYYEWFGQGTPIDTMYPSREACRQDTALLHIDPHHYPPFVWFACDPADPWHRGNDRLHEKLTAIGIPHVADLNSEYGGHTWAYFDAMAPRALQYLAESLEKQSRRLL